MKGKLLTGLAAGLALSLSSCSSGGSSGAAEVTELKNATDSLSYAIGVNIAAGSQKDQMDINPDALYAGLQSIFKPKEGGTALLYEQQSRDFIMAYNRKIQQERMLDQVPGARENLAASTQWLEQNKTKDSVQVHPSGLQYKVLHDAEGGKSPTVQDKIRINYRGTLTNGQQFDASPEGQPVEFNLNGLIPGWRIALPLMGEGDKWRLFIPPDLGYGVQAPPNIGPNQALVFDIELLAVIPAGPPPQPK